MTAVLGEKFQGRLRGDELVHQPPADGLKNAVDELKSQACDFQVLLAHAPVEEARKLATQFPVFDLVVASGETALPSRDLEAVEGAKTKLMQIGQKAMYVGVVGLFDEEKAPLRYEHVPLDAQFERKPMWHALARAFAGQPWP